MDIKDSYLHGTVGVVKSISVTADKLTYKLADKDNTSVDVTLPLATQSANGLLSKGDKTKLDNLVSSVGDYVTRDTEQTITGVKTFTKQLKFTVAQGTAPFAVTSSTKVTNLNADYLDGYNSSAYIPKLVYSYSQGCLVRTSIPTDSSTMFSFRIEGNSYEGLKSILTTGQFYNYNPNESIIRSSATHHGYDFGKINVFCYEGYVCLWFKQVKDYLSFAVSVYSLNISADGINRVESISNTTMPTSGVSRLVEITPIIGIDSDNYTSYVNTTNFPGLNKVGTVTSVAVANGGGLSVSGSPITSSGTITITNTGVRSISTGTANGTISVNTNGASANVAVKGLDSAAYVSKNKFIQQIHLGTITGPADLYNRTKDYFGDCKTIVTLLKSEEGSWGHLLLKFLNPTKTEWGVDGSGLFMTGSTFYKWCFTGKDTEEEPLVVKKYKIYDESNCNNSSTSWTASKFIGNLDGTYVNKLTGYTKATSASDLAATDSLNTALGKLEYKADAAYDLVKGAYDGDGTIENLAEILKVLEGIKDTETILAIIGKYLPLIGGTLTGKLTIQKDSFGSLIIYRKDSLNSASIQFKNSDNVSLGYIGMKTANKCLYRFSANSDSSYTIWDSGNDGSDSGLDADLLDGVHASGLLTALSSGTTTNLSITVGGTTKSITNLYARRLGLSSNTITSTTDDTTAKWGPLGTSVHFYGTKDQLTDQPLLYGLLLNVSNTSSEVHQIWMTQSSGNLYHRGGNSSGWSGSWRTILDSVNTHIKSGVITINGTTITPLTQHQSLANYVTLDTDQTITGLKTFESNSSTTGVALKLKNKGWAGGMSTAMDFYNGAAYTVPNARIETKMVGSDNAGGTLIFYTLTNHESTNPNPNGLTERLRIDDNGLTKITGFLTVTGDLTAAKFITSGGTSSLFVKGDGSLDSNKYLINTHSTHTSAYYRKTAVNGVTYAFWSPVSTDTYSIYAPTTEGTKDLILVSNGSGAPVWSELANITAGSLKPTVILASGSNTFKYVKFASINLTLRYSGKYAVLKLAQYFTMSTNYANSCDVHVHCYQLDEMGVAPEYTIQTNNDDNYFEIIGIVNYSTTNSTLDLYVYGKGSTYKSINVTTIIGNNIISIGSNIDSLPTGTIVIPTKMGHVAAANNGIFYIGGTGTTAGTWLGSHTGITSYYVGLTIAYKIPIAGASTTTLNINSLGAKTCYINTSKLTTHYGVGSVAILVYDGTYFRTADYDYTTTKVRLYLDTSAKEYPLAFRYDNTAANSSGYVNEYLRYASTITVNPSTSTITATTFNGTATLVACTATTDDVTRPIVLTNTSSKLYYTTKATINYKTGNITAPTFTGSLVGNADTSSKLNMTVITSYSGLTPVGVYGYTNTNNSTDSNDFPHTNPSSAIAWGKDNCKVIIAARAGQTNADVYIRLYYTSWGNWYKLWNEGNDGADSGLDADLLDGTHKADLFTSLTNVNTKANPYSLSATIGGTTKFLQVNSFSLAALDIRDTTPTPNDVSDKSVTAWFNNKDTPGSAYWYSGITVAGWNNAYGVWLLASNSDQSDTETSLHFRTGRVDTWGAWKKVLDSSNYTSYTVKKDGTGASGTWEISITGNAATASKVTCTEASSNNDRPIVGTNMDNLLYYTKKATVNWSTGHIKVGNADVNGALNVIGSNSFSEGIRLHHYNGLSSLWFGAVNNSGYDAGMWGISVDSLGMRFRGTSSTTGTSASDYINIIHGGNVGIGTSAPAQKLSVDGNVLASLFMVERTATSDIPALHVNASNNPDVTVLRISTGNQSTLGDHGFSLKYLGTGGGNANLLNLYADNQAVTEQVMAISIDLAGDVGIGLNASSSYKLSVNGSIYSSTGFVKNESSNSYVLLGGGGHKTISSLSVASANSLKSTKVIESEEFKLSNASWTDTGYTFASLTTGTYAVQVTSGSNLVASGIMSVYTNLSDTAGDEIPLHVYGTAGWRPYLRTYANKLLISSNDISVTSRTVTIKIALIL